MKRRIWSHNAEAILWVLASTGMFSVIFAAGKFAGESASVPQISLLRQFGAVLTLAVMMLARGEGPSDYLSRRPLAHLVRTIFGVVGGLAVVQAAADMPIVDSTALSLLYVVFVVILGMIFFRERIGPRQMGGILVCAAGAFTIVISRGAFQHFDMSYLWPAGMAVAGALLFAFEAIFIKFLAQNDRPLTVMMHVNIFSLFLLAVPAWYAWKPLPWSEFFLYWLYGPLGLVAQYCLIRGFRLADISVVGPVDYSWLVFASIIGFVFFGEVPTTGVVAGSALILIGGVVLASVRPSKPRQPVAEFSGPAQ